MGHTMGRANLPDAYDETIETTSTETGDCSDILRLMASILKDRPEVIERTRAYIERGSTSLDLGLDAAHIALCFAVELVDVTEHALALTPTVAAQVLTWRSPLLMADAMRFFHKICLKTTLSPEDISHVFRVCLMTLESAACEPDVLTSVLAVLRSLAQYSDAYGIFKGNFRQVCTNDRMPLRLAQGFCEAFRIACRSREAELACLALPIRDAVLHDIASWDPNRLADCNRIASERRLVILAGLVPLGCDFFGPV